MPFNLDREPITVSTTLITTVEGTVTNGNKCVSEVCLPKLVVCLDISTLSLKKLKAIANNLKLPDYSQMTKGQLWEILLAL